MASVTVRIPGSEDVTVVGKVFNLSDVSPVIPMAIGSMMNIDMSPPIEMIEEIIEPPADMTVETHAGRQREESREEV